MNKKNRIVRARENRKNQKTQLQKSKNSKIEHKTVVPGKLAAIPNDTKTDASGREFDSKYFQVLKSGAPRLTKLGNFIFLNGMKAEYKKA